jgi:hypothetical protein
MDPYIIPFRDIRLAAGGKKTLLVEQGIESISFNDEKNALLNHNTAGSKSPHPLTIVIIQLSIQIYFYTVNKN